MADYKTMAQHIAVALSVWVSVHAGAAPLPPVPPGAYSGLDAPTLQVLQAARAADSIDDPLQRCLTFPDFPGNQWVKDVARLNCDFAGGKFITLDDIIARLDKGDVAGLEATFRRDLDLHYSATNFSEAIHYNFWGFNENDARADAASQRWLTLAPDSAFANHARGRYLSRLAWAARGTRLMSQTPEANVRKMNKFAAEAVEALGRSVRLEPKMLPAYVALMDMSLITGNEPLGNAAFERASALDPGCHSMAHLRMKGLFPKWGGSAELMAAYATQLQELVARRPLISLVLAQSLTEVAASYSSNKQWAQAIAIRERGARLAPDANLFNQLGWNYVAQGPETNAQAMVALLTAYRYQSGDFETLRNLGSQLYKFKDYAWAHKLLAAASLAEANEQADEPSIQVPSQLGATLINLGRYSEAIPHLMKGLKPGSWRRFALFHLVRAFTLDKQFSKAEQYANEFSTEFPAVSDGWLNMIEIHEGTGNLAKLRLAMKSYLQHVDRNNPRNAAQIAQIEKALASGTALSPE